MYLVLSQRNRNIFIQFSSYESLPNLQKFKNSQGINRRNRPLLVQHQ